MYHASLIITGMQEPILAKRVSAYFYFIFHIQFFSWINFRYVATLFYWKLENLVILPN